MSNENKLSDRAKGKQRAYPVNGDTKLGQEIVNRTQAKPNSSKIQLAIRFTDGAPDLLLEMYPDDTGASVMSAVSELTVI